MKILFISPYLPHPLCGHGAGVFIYELISRMAPHHEISVVSFCDRKEEELAKSLKSLPIKFYSVARSKGTDEGLISQLQIVVVRTLQLMNSILHWEPYYVSKYRNKKMRGLVEELTNAESFDVVQIEFTQMAQYIKNVHGGKSFLHELDVSFKPAYRRFKNSKNVFRKFIAYIEWCRWATYEPAIAKMFDSVLTVTDQDRLLLRWLTKNHDVRYFPHAVDVAPEIPQYAGRKSHTLVFMGTYLHHPNVDAAIWLCKEIFPEILKKYPGAVLYILGTHPSSEMKSLAAMNPRIKLMGFVDDVNVYLRDSAIFITPLRFGGGVKNKVLFAMAQGIPVVSTPIGIEGIDGINTDNVLLGNSVEKLVECVSFLFENPDKAAKFGTAGWENVQKWYSWESVIKKLEEIYASIGAGRIDK